MANNNWYQNPYESPKKMGTHMLEEGHSLNRPPLFNIQHYNSWKTRMESFIKAEDYQLWQIVENGPLLIKDGKPEDGYTEEDEKKLQKNAKAKVLLHCALGSYEYGRVSAFSSAKEIWDFLKAAYENSIQLKWSNIDLLERPYEVFSMGENESVVDMYSRFTNIVNELKSVGKVFSTEELVRKILRSLPKCWMYKVTAIEEFNDLTTLSLEELIDKLMAHEVSMHELSQQGAFKKDIKA